MRRFFRTAVGKTVLFMLTMVAGVAAVASAVGIAFMAGGNVYSRTQQQVYDDLIENMMIQDGRMILENHLFAADTDNMDMGNLEYEFLDGQQKVIASSQKQDTSWDHSYYYRVETDGESFDYYYDPEGKAKAEAALYDASIDERKQLGADYLKSKEKQQNTVDSAVSEVSQEDTEKTVASKLVEGDDTGSEDLEDSEPRPSTSETAESEVVGEGFTEEDEDYQNEGTWGEVTWYTLHCSLKADLPEEDKYAWTATAVDIAYELRYGVYVILLVSLAVLVLSFVGLMSVAGRRPDTEEVHAGLLHKVPSDVLLAADATIAMLPLAVTVNIGSGEHIVYVILNTISGLFCCGVCLGVCMSLAARIKQRTLIKNSLIGMLCRLCWRGIRFVFGWIKKMWQNLNGLMRTLPFARRVTAIYAAVTLIEFVLLLAGVYLPIWFILHLVLLPLILFTAMTLQKLKKAGEALAAGNLTYHTDTEKMYGDLKEHGENLNSIASGMAIAVEERLKSERMKTELITNVSHDIKTPLTSIINYATLIGAEPCENEKITEYADVLVRQSERLKRLIEDLVEASKASSGNLEVNMSPCDAAVFISQAGGEYEEKLKKAGLTLVTKQPEQEVRIMADGRRMWRIFDNLMNNICKYAQSGTRVYLTLEVIGSNAVFSFKNTSRDELNVSPDELMERFVRGDASRNTEGNGLGLSIAKSMAQLQGGTLEISTDADLFRAILSFPIVQSGSVAL